MLSRRVLRAYLGAQWPDDTRPRNMAASPAVRRLSSRLKEAMVTREDIENFLDRIATEGATYEEVEPGLWVVHPGGALDLDVVVHYSPPVVLLRMKVMSVPADGSRSSNLNRRLLELNANDLVHGSYGITGDSIVLTEALELSHLDFEEFLSSYESMTLALVTHMRELASFKEDR